MELSSWTRFVVSALVFGHRLVYFIVATQFATKEQLKHITHMLCF
jgi:hypothetical protein